MRFYSLLLGILFAVVPLSVSRAQRTAASTATPPTARYIVVLDGEPAAATFARVKAGQGAPAARTAARARVVQIRSQHDNFSASLRQLNVSELGRFSKLINAVHIRATPAQAAAVRRLPGVRRVERVQLYQPETASSVPFIGTAKVWGGTPAADGSGMRLGIIDSGIDYTHADFGGSGIVSDYTSNDHTVIEPGTFPTAKVAGGWDFVGDDFNADDSANDIPNPDPDPI
ncbi:MAG TPA: hypothetical protein VN761_10500, partial [Candidatus Polarisedimenticolia bacterium]|nr:hypothetical protein [Candidatus Polarisedimenticolia bacterium]